MGGISMHDVLSVVGGFDGSGGASLGLVAWELSVEEAQVVVSWTEALKDGLLEPARRDPVGDEHMWRLTADGWAALDRAGQVP
jgi:hypothetical protein